MRRWFCLILLVLVPGCTEQMRARGYGGSAVVVLPAGEKLINVTWKESDLWCLTRKAREDEGPEQFYLRESSSFGLLQGTVVIREARR